MLVQDAMQTPVYTALVDQSLEATYRFMQTEKVRHLPVLQDGQLVGVITDRDLRYATSRLHERPFEPGDRVGNVMSTPPITIGPLEPVEEAARLMRQHAIGCLPVLDAGNLAGIVTGTDLLDALMRMTGITKPGGRLAVRLPDTPGRLAALTGRVAQEEINIRSVLSYNEDDDHLYVLLHIDTINTHELADALRTESFDVVWPPQRPRPAA